MTRPIEPHETDKDLSYDFPKDGMNNEPRNGGKKNAKETSSSRQQASVFGIDFGSVPELPPAIMEPPQVRMYASKHDLNDVIIYESIR